MDKQHKHSKRKRNAAGKKNVLAAATLAPPSKKKSRSARERILRTQRSYKVSNRYNEYGELLKVPKCACYLDASDSSDSESESNETIGGRDKENKQIKPHRKSAMKKDNRDKWLPTPGKSVAFTISTASTKDHVRKSNIRNEKKKKAKSLVVDSGTAMESAMPVIAVLHAGLA